MNSSIAPRSQAALVFSALLIAAFLAGCRAPVPVEGDLRPQAFQTNGATLTKDGAGRLFVVAARGQTPARFALVKDQGQSHLFWTQPVGERAAQLYPLTRFTIDWYNQAMGRRPVELFDEIDDIAVSDTLGLWRGGSEGSIRWLGPLPSERSRAVVLNANAELNSPSLADYIVGTLEVDADGVVEQQEVFPSQKGPYLVLIDGPRRDASPRAAVLVKDPPSTPQHWTLLDDKRRTEFQNEATLAQRAGEIGVEILIAWRGDQWFAGFAKDGAAPGFGPLAQQPALVESGFLLPADSDASTRRQTLEVLDELYKGHPLSAAYRLAKLEGWSVDNNREATLLRHQDLVAAAGFIPWARAAILDGRQGIGPEASIYLGRAYIYAGHGPAVLAHTARAQSLFRAWPDEQGAALGVARALELESKGRLLSKDRRSAEAALQSAQEQYKDGGDLFRQALAARDEALLNIDDADFFIISDQFQSAQAYYEAFRTLALGAAAYLERDDVEKAQEILDALKTQETLDDFGVQETFKKWRANFNGAAPERLELFYRALELRARQQGGAEIDVQDLTPLRTRASQIHAWEALLVAGLVSQGQHALSGGDEIRAFVYQLREASERSGADLFAAQTRQALRVLCTDLVFFGQHGGASALDRHCAEQIATMVDSAEGAQTFLEAGYRLLQQGALDGASSIAQALLESTLADQVLRAKFLLLEAAILDERAAMDEEENAEEIAAVIQDAFDLLRGALAPREAPGVLKELGDEFALRGFDGHSVALYQASRQAALNANRTTVEFDAALHLARALFEAGRWRELAELSAVESPLHGARIQLYQAQANIALDNRGVARDLITQVLGQAQGYGDLQRVSILHLAAMLAMERGDDEAAHEWVEQAQYVHDELPESRAGREEAQVLRARTLGLRVQLMLSDGAQQEAARRLLPRAFEIMESLPPDSAPAVRRQLLELAVKMSDEPQQVEAYLDRMKSLAQRVQSTNPFEAQKLTVAAAHIQLRLGQSEQAARALKPTLAKGYGLATARAEHHCVLGEVLLSGLERAQAREHLKSCVATGESSHRAERAQLLLALSDSKATPTFRADLAQHIATSLSSNQRGERARLRWMAALIRAQKSDDEALEARLRDAFHRAAQADGTMSNAERVVAATELIDHLLDTAQFSEADRLLQSESAALHLPGTRGEYEWARLRLTSLIRQLRPFDAQELLEQTLQQSAPPDDQAEAQLLYLRAAAHLQAGHDLLATELLAQAKVFATSQPTLLDEIEALESTLNVDGSAP